MNGLKQDSNCVSLEQGGLTPLSPSPNLVDPGDVSQGHCHAEEIAWRVSVPDVAEPSIGDITAGYEIPKNRGGAHAQSCWQTANLSAPLLDSLLPLGTVIPSRTDWAVWLRLEVRRLIREFLCFVPRSEEKMTLTFPRSDGTARTVTRAELSRAIDQMRPRQGQVIRLAVEGNLSQEEVRRLLHGVSVRTIQRDQTVALDLLAKL